MHVLFLFQTNSRIIFSIIKIISVPWWRVTAYLCNKLLVTLMHISWGSEFPFGFTVVPAYLLCNEVCCDQQHKNILIYKTCLGVILAKRSTTFYVFLVTITLNGRVVFRSTSIERCSKGTYISVKCLYLDSSLGTRVNWFPSK